MLPAAEYNCIVIDPPWPMKKIEREVRPNHPHLPFAVMWSAPRSMAANTERGTIKEAASILGIRPRKLQAMSQRGEIPGAAKIGRQWTYDLVKLRGFVSQQEQACHQGTARPRPVATGGEIPSGAALKSVGGSSAGRLTRMIQQSQRRVGKLAKPER
jgi:hypothetical protein